MKRLIISIMLISTIFSRTSFGAAMAQEEISDFVYERDGKDALKIFHDDWACLFPSNRPTYDHEYLLQQEIPNEKFLAAKYDGKFTMKVARKNDQLVGLVSFYGTNTAEGRIHIISIAHHSLEKEYGRTLAVVALRDLFGAGCTSVCLYTRKDNEKVSVYEELGFQDIGLSEDDISWFKEVGITPDEYANYTRFKITKERFEA